MSFRVIARGSGGTWNRVGAEIAITHHERWDGGGYLDGLAGDFAKLPMPKLILHALQVNMAGGRLPASESNGTRYLKIPLDRLAYAVWD